MPTDLSPEEIAIRSGKPTSLTMEEAAQLEDVGAQSDPEAIISEREELATKALSSDWDRVHWPSSDELAPDFRYLAKEDSATEFELTPDALELLIGLNRYEPYRDKQILAFALRGAQLVSGHEVERAERIAMRQVRPDHRHFRCVIGFYFMADRRLTAYSGSTVPCRSAVYKHKHGNKSGNMLPTGLYTYFIWRHRQIRPALRLSLSGQDPETAAQATVLRSKNDYQMETTDLFDYTQEPWDNVHCSYFLEEKPDLGAFFSSEGCLTVRGKNGPSSDQWKKFQAVLKGLGERTRVDLLLVTGKDAAIAASAGGDRSKVEGALTALRHGSRGPEVSRLQEKLGTDATGFFGATTLDKLTGRQRDIFSGAGQGRIADGIYSKGFDALTGWGIFSGPQPGV